MVGHKGLSSRRWSLIAQHPVLRLLLLINQESWRDTGPSKGTFIPSVDLSKTKQSNHYPAVASFSLLQRLDGFDMVEF